MENTPHIQYFLAQISNQHYSGRDGVSNHQPHDCLRNRLFRHTSKKTSKPCVTGLCEGNSPVTDEFPAQRASNAENVSIWWRHHEIVHCVATWLFYLPRHSSNSKYLPPAHPVHQEPMTVWHWVIVLMHGEICRHVANAHWSVYLCIKIQIASLTDDKSPQAQLGAD